MPVSPENTIMSTLRRWRDDWPTMAREAFRVTLDKEQTEILRAVQTNRRVSVRSGTSRGKDFVAAVAALCFLYTRYPSKVILTAPTDRQVRYIMMPEITDMFNRCGFNLPGRLLDKSIKLPDKKHFLIGFKAQSSSTESWSGFHSPNLMVVATEASGLEQTTFDAIEGILQGNSRLLLVFNPNRREGESYKSVKSPQYVKFKMNCLQAPNVQAKEVIYPGQVDWVWVDERVKMPGWTQEISKQEHGQERNDFEWGGKYYRPNDLFLIKVMGEFPSESSDKLIPLEWVEAARDRYNEFVRGGIKVEGRNAIGVDVAGMGRDQSIIGHRQELFLHPFEVEPKRGKEAHMALAGRVKNKLDTVGGEAYIDAIGEGAGVLSRLEEQEVNAVSAKFSYVRKGLRDVTGQIGFANMRAYCYWAVRDWLNPAYDSKAMIPPDDELMAQLVEHKYKFLSNGTVLIEPKEEVKKRIGISPDKSDVLALTFWPAEEVVDKPTHRHKSDYGFF